MSEEDPGSRQISIKVPVLARVEGEGALEFSARNGRIEEVRLRIFEPPRLFEKFLEGRSYEEVPDTVARICGICPVAYQMSAVQAIESVFQVEVSDWVLRMRRAMYCGEWLQSHALHIHLLALPDFLGFDSVTAMAEQYPHEVRRGLALQGLGNRLIALFGGRSVHPVGVCVGGFHHAPEKKAVQALREELLSALEDAEALLHWCSDLPLPDDQQAFTSVALHSEAHYAIEAGGLVSDQGLAIGIGDYRQHFSETQLPHSTAFHSHLHGRPYLVGPLARLNLNHAQLPEQIQALMQARGITFPSNNMFHSLYARAIEIHYALTEAIRLLEDYQPQAPKVDVSPRAGIGYGCSEAPRGILWHRYELDEAGRVLKADIVPPTSQNQARIEEDLRDALMNYGLQHSDEELQLRAETVIRNYDPCISCATHFLRLKVHR